MKLRNVAYAAVIALASAMLVLGSAGTSEAKGKKKVAAPPPPIWCGDLYKPVCAVKPPTKLKFTYANACFAIKDGAKIVSQGPCKKAVKKAKKKKAKKAKK